METYGQLRDLIRNLQSFDRPDVEDSAPLVRAFDLEGGQWVPYISQVPSMFTQS